MRWWPSKRIEKRQGAYTDAVVAQILSRAGGSIPDPSATAALEIAAGLWSRSFGAATVKPSISAITASMLACISRELIRVGECIFAIEVSRDGRFSFHPAGSWDVVGGTSPESWRYRLDLFGPSGSTTRIYPWESVLHFQFAHDRVDSPWQGLGPLQYASSTGKLAGGLERLLGQEVSARSGYVIPVPADGGDDSEDDPLASLKTDIAALDGSASLVETVASSWGEGRGAAPSQDWAQKRIGASPPDVLEALRTSSGASVLAACGVPPGLADPRAEGGGQRESFRRFIHTSVQPASVLVAEEFTRKLEVEVSLSFESLFASDLSGRARSLASMVKAGVDLTKAMALSGLLLDE